MSIKPIETLYDGHRFRSRIEARWAVFFKTLCIPYEYEKEGFNLGQHGFYLPDFWLANEKIWVEIKGQEPTHEECMKAFALADQSANPVIILSGDIGVRPDGLLVRPLHKTLATYGYHQPPIDHHQFYLFDYRFNNPEGGLEKFLKEQLPNETIPTYDGTKETLIQLIELDRKYFLQTYDRDHESWKYGITDYKSSWNYKDGRLTLGWDMIEAYPQLIDAYRTARSARFEHGEKPY